MKKILTAALCALVCLSLLLSVGAAESLTLSGTVIPAENVPVYAPIGGTVGEVLAEEGQLIGADDVLYTMKTTKVYAEEDGTVTGVFAQPGDSAETVAERYGAVLYLEGKSVFTVSASTENAYNSTETKFIHVGEAVYLQCRTSNERKGQGIVTAVSGTSFTVRVESGTFIAGDSVDVFRDEACSTTKKIGRGSVERTSPTAVSASGSVVRIAVEDGAQVKRGDLLLETLDGSFDGLYMSGTEIAAGQAGVVGSLSVNQGGSVQKDAAVAVIYPLENMRAEAYVPEDSRNLIKEGDPVIIELEADESKTYQGTVKLVSSVASSDNGEVTYRVLAEFVPDDDVRFGMSVVISTAEEEAAAETEEASSEEPAQDETASAEPAEKPEGFPERPDGEKPEGFPEGEKPEGFPEGFPEGMPAGEGTENNENANP